MKNISIIVAVDEKMGIGKNGVLAWHLQGDMQYFKETTLETKEDDMVNAVIMGKNTWESIPQRYRPLEQRVNYVLTSDKEYNPDGALICHSFEEALSEIDENELIEGVYIIGGSQVYELALKSERLETIYVTRVVGDFECDTFFTDIPNYFHLTEKGNYFEEGDLFYSFEVYKRR